MIMIIVTKIYIFGVPVHGDKKIGNQMLKKMKNIRSLRWLNKVFLAARRMGTKNGASFNCPYSDDVSAIEVKK